MLGSFRDFVFNEQITSVELTTLAKHISDSIDNEHNMEKITIFRDITKNPQQIKINMGSGQDEGPTTTLDNTLARNLVNNYKFYFGKIANQFQHAEAILYQFPGYQTFIVYLGFLTDGRKLAAFAVPPYYYVPNVRKKNIASSFPRITSILRQFGFKVHAQGDNEEIATEQEDMEFLNKLVGIFRFVSSRYFDFSKGAWDRAKGEFYKLQQEMPQQYQNYIGKLAKAYPGGVMARRKVDLQPDFMLQTVNGEEMPVKEVANKDIEVYYPNYYVYSQWTEDAMDPKTMDTAFSSKGGVPYLFRGKIPTDQIIYSQRILPTGLTQLKVEGEIIVDHAPGKSGDSLSKHDQNIVCHVYKMSDFQWAQQESLRFPFKF